MCDVLGLANVTNGFAPESLGLVGRWIPSRELTYPTLGSLENHLQNAILGGYVSSLEGKLFFRVIFGLGGVRTVRFRC